MDNNIEKTISVAKTSTSNRTVMINTLKAVRDLFLKYNNLDDTRKQLMDEMEDVHRVVPEEVPVPEYIEYPSKPEVTPAKKSRVFSILGVLLIVAGIALFGVGTFYLVPNGLYECKYVFLVANFPVTELAIASVIAVILGILLMIVSSAINRGKEKKAVELFNAAMKEYNNKFAEVKEQNDHIQEEYDQKIAEAQRIADEENEKLKNTIEERNKLREMKISAAEKTMSHLQEEYMKKYSKFIPADYASPEGITKLLDVAENNEKLTTIGQVTSAIKSL